MLFNSFEFLIFLPLTFLFYWFVCKSRLSKNIFLILASYLFYGWWDYRFLFLIIFITLISYVSGIIIGEKRLNKRACTFLFIVVLTLLGGTLFVFKYFNFFTQSFVRILQAIGFTPDVPTMDIILPVGISFYTFQAASYVIDVWKGTQKATKDWSSFFVFISFFPQLVAGPIERASNILPQFQANSRTFTYERGVTGMKLILWGLFKKMVVADNAAIIVNTIFLNWQTESTINLWVGAFLFTFQIYGDFSGYSDIAIGTSRLFGIDLMKNFALPYFSRDITEFWKKWHISLTGWFRDYVYIPLGGNRKGKKHTISNTATVFLVSGLWHGANFTYLLWGVYHAILFIPFRVFGKIKYKRDVPLLRDSLMIGVTFLLVMIGWVIFRAESVGHAFGYIGRMFSHYVPGNNIQGKTAILWCIILVCLEWSGRKKETPLNFPEWGVFSLKGVRWACYVTLFMITLIFAGQTQDFIYFQF